MKQTPRTTPEDTCSRKSNLAVSGPGLQGAAAIDIINHVYGSSGQSGTLVFVMFPSDACGADRCSAGQRTVMQCGWLHSGPPLWLRCVHRQVRVTAGTRREQHGGWLLTVDPVSRSVALVSFGEAGASVRVVLGHAVEHVEVLQEPDPDTEERLRALLPPPDSGGPDPDERRRIRSAVRRWLQQNRVPVEEDGNELRVARVLTIRSPYRPDDCSSANQIILDRVQRLLRVQPDPVPPGPSDGL